MKLVRTSNDQLVFKLSRTEKNYLFGILHLYPLVSPVCHFFGKNAAWLDQSLLEGLMQRERQNNRQKIDAFLLGNEKLAEEESEDLQMELTIGQADWLLRVLNDLRLGSWIMMGNPFPASSQETEFNQQTSSYLAAMQICGFFQMALLQGLVPLLESEQN